MHEKGDVISRADQRAGVDHAVGHDAFERRGDFQVRLKILERSHRGLRHPRGLLAGVQQRLAASTCFSAWITSLPAMAPGVSAAFFMRS